MPVVGHAVVGLATALRFRPTRDTSGARERLAAGFWTPLVVTCAYLPDIATQIGRILGWRFAEPAGHSMPLGLAAGLVFAALWVRVTGAQFRLTLAVITGSILCHDALDLLTTAGRTPFWPLLGRETVIGIDVLPHGTLAETLFFGVPLAGYLAWGGAGGGRSRAHRVPEPGAAPWVAWTARAVVMLVVTGAVVTHAARGPRWQQLRAAESLLRRGDFEAAIEMADRADHWPHPGRLGRLDRIRGAAHQGLGDLAGAEAFYLRAYRDDPAYIWALADLAEYYTAVNRPIAERRRLAQPYLDELRQRFSGHQAFPYVLSRVEQQLRAAR